MSPYCTSLYTLEKSGVLKRRKGIFLYLRSFSLPLSFLSFFHVHSFHAFSLSLLRDDNDFQFSCTYLVLTDMSLMCLAIGQPGNTSYGHHSYQLDVISCINGLSACPPAVHVLCCTDVQMYKHQDTQHGVDIPGGHLKTVFKV